MKQATNILAFLFIIASVFTSCRKEEAITDIGPDQPVLESGSTVAGLMKSMSLQDGSIDNIIDNANCFSIQLPVTVIVNGVEVDVNSESDFDSIEDIFDEFDDDSDTLQIIFPITLILPDYTEITVNDQTELDNIAKSCSGENESDDDIECLDFVYPISVSVFDVVTEQKDSISLANDNELYRFLEGFEDDKIVTIYFPVALILYDGTEISVNNLGELEAAIEANKDACDEDDDYDFNDDDPTQQQIVDILSSCSDWIVEQLERTDNELEDNYSGFLFNFLNDGNILIQANNTSYSGTWSIIETAGSVKLNIYIAELPDFNGEWTVNEIEQDESDNTSYKIDLRNGEDSLSFGSICN